MTDHELLKLAAIAAKFEVKSASELSGIGQSILKVKRRYPPLFPDVRTWKPLDDDGDAFRLAVNLNICTLISAPVSRHAQVGAGLVGGDKPACMEWVEKDRCAAMRRAIVRAAAEIGKRITEQDAL